MPVAVGGRRAPADGPRPPAHPRAPEVRVVPLAADDRVLERERLLLAPSERAHADRGTTLVARRRAMLRAGLRRLVGEILAVPPATVPLRSGFHGRPELDVDGVDVACSRTGDVGLVAVAAGLRLGIDVEAITPWHDDVLDEHWLSHAEQQALRGLDLGAKAVAATRCWTRKEAVLKGIGTGLTDAVADLEAGIGEDAVLVAGWRVHNVPLPPGAVASIAMLPVGRDPFGTLTRERSSHGHAHH